MQKKNDKKPKSIFNKLRTIKLVNKKDNDKDKFIAAKPPVKIRKPYIDVVRILGMYAIIVHHILVHGHVIRKYGKYYQLRLLNTSLFWHVSSFALISGIVGYKTSKYSNILYLWLCIFFYSVGFNKLFQKYKPNYVNKQSINYDIFPVIYNKYWYATQYFGMYFFLPVINKGIENISKGDLKLVVLSLMGIFIIWKDYMTNADVFHANSGYSVLWLITFYITGSYFGKYEIKINNIFNKILFCLFLIFVYCASCYLCFYMPIKFGKYRGKKLFIFLSRLFVHRINSATMILQAISITLFFSQIKYNKLIGKIITFFGPLTFGVYLIHENYLVRSYVIGRIFEKDSYNLPLKRVIHLVLYRSFLVFIKSSIIEYIRYILFLILRVRTILIFLEKRVKKIFE